MRLRTGLPAAMLIGLMLVLLMFVMSAARVRPAANGHAPAPAPDVPVTAVAPFTGDAAAGTDAGREWTLAGQLGGTLTDVAWLGGYALLGFGPRVAVVDVTAPNNPRLAATGPRLPDLAWGIAVADDRVYVASGESGLFVLDAADPLNLQVTGSLDLPTAAYDVQVSGDYAYVAVDDGLRIVNVHDPARLEEVGSLTIPGGGWRLGVGDGVVVLVERFSSAMIVDVRDPRQPLRVSKVAAEAVDVVLVGDYAIVAEWANQLVVIDLADSARLTRVEVGAAETRLQSVAVDGSTAYAGDERGAVHVLDLSDPAHPRASGQTRQIDSDHDQPVGVSALAVRSGVALAICVHDISKDQEVSLFSPIWHGAAALRVVDATQPTQPRVTATLRMPSAMVRDVDVAADGRSVWVIDSSNAESVYRVTPEFARNAAWRIDVADSARPQVGARLSMPVDVDPVALASSGSHVYVLGVTRSARSSDIYVFDASNPAAPEFDLAVGLSGEGRTESGYRFGVDMLVVGEFLLISEVGGPLHLLDLSNPAAPRVLEAPAWWKSSLFPVTGWVASDPFVFIAFPIEGQSGVGALDLRDPTMPRLAGRMSTDEITGIAVSDNTVLVADTDDTLHVIDASNWANLRELGRVAVPASAFYTAVSAFADRAFTIGTGGELAVLDIASPASPVVLQTIAPATSKSLEEPPRLVAPVVAAAPGRVYASAHGLGLMVYVDGPAAEPPAPDRPHRSFLPAVYRSHQRPPTLRRRKLELVGKLPSDGKPYQVLELEADDQYAYLAMGFAFPGQGICDGRLGIVDVARPASPMFAATIDLPFTPVAVRVVDGRAYVAGVACKPAGSGAMAIVDVAQPDRPRVLGNLSLPQAVFDLAVVGRRAYVLEVPTSSPFDGLPDNPGIPRVRIIDAADPSALSEVGSVRLDHMSHVTGIAALNNLVLVSDFYVGLSIFDVAIATAPREVARLPLPGAFDVTVEGDRAMVVDVEDADGTTPIGLWIVDVVDPAQPRGIGALVAVYPFDTARRLSGLRVAASDGIAYTNIQGALRAFDVRDPAWPYVLDEVVSNALGVAASGRRVYTVGEDGLSIFELVDR